MIKAIVIGVALVVVAGACAPKAVTLSASASEENSMIVERKNTFVPPTVNDGEYPNMVDLVSDYTLIPNWVYSSPLRVEKGQESFSFDFGTVYQGRTYVAVKAECEWGANGEFTLTAVEFAPFNVPTYYTVWNLDYPYVFSALTVNNYYILYENYQGLPTDGLDKFDVDSTSVYLNGENGNVSLAPVVYTELRTTAGGPYYVYGSPDDFLSRLEKRLYLNFVVNAPDYQNGYNKGIADGYAQINSQAQQEAYDRGYADGARDGNSNLTSLFGAVVGVPIDLLNGLSPLVIWNFPIITIIVTFTFLALALFIIKKLMGK